MKTTITDVHVIGVPVTDQDKALTFFIDKLGFEKRLDARISDSFRWVTVAAPGASTAVALIADAETGVGADTGIRFTVPDAEAEHTAMRQEGVDVGDLLRWPGAPPMYEFKDLDGNRYEIVEELR